MTSPKVHPMSLDNCICTVDCPLTEDKHYINCPAHTYYNEAYFRPALEASSRQEERLRLALESAIRALDTDSTPIVRRLARIQIRNALEGCS